MNNLRKRSAKGAVALALFISFSGCALQASMVDLENDHETLKNHQRELQGRLERLEKGAAAPAPSAQKIQTESLVRLDSFGTELQALTGRIEEEKHLLSTFAKRMEDQSYRLEALLGRLDALESRISALEKEGDKPVEPREGKTILPGRSLDSKLKGGNLAPTEAYNLAYNDYLKGNYDLAVSGFQNFLQQYPGSALTPQAIYWIGESYYNKKSYAKAIEFFDRVQQEYAKSEKAPNALLKEGFAYLELGDRVKARIYLKKVVEQFPGSNEANLAKDKLSDLR
ncbi:MAG TPA: tol-pal system protein YbgF [Candidatus Manganitrophaceae bacterium]|nr:tol-pal system protein YbgF [Candidatus Manganitrophaceae bacterium]